MRSLAILELVTQAHFETYKNSKRLLPAVFCLSLALVLLIFAPVHAQSNSTSNKDKEVYKVEEQLSINTVVHAMSEEISEYGVVVQTEIMPDQNGKIPLKKKTLLGLQPVPSMVSDSSADLVIFSGLTEPNIQISLVVSSDKVIKRTMSNSSGIWQIVLLADELDAGSHQARLLAAVNGRMTSKYLAADLTVNSYDIISNATWIFMTIVGAALIIFMMTINFIFLYERQITDRYKAPPSSNAI